MWHVVVVLSCVGRCGVISCAKRQRKTKEPIDTVNRRDDTQHTTTRGRVTGNKDREEKPTSPCSASRGEHGVETTQTWSIDSKVHTQIEIQHIHNKKEGGVQPADRCVPRHLFVVCVVLLLENEVLRSPRVEFAFRLVDRARFVPQLESATPTATHRHTQADTSMRDHQAYIDGPLKVGMVHISAPHMYAVVLEKLQLESGMRFLNVGSGSGYLSCMGSILVGRGGASHGVERLEEVVTHARTCAHNWRRYVDQLRRAQRQEAKEKEKISTPRDGAQPDKMDVEMKTCEEPMAGIGATTTADAFSRMSSGRSSPFVEDEEMSDATQHDVASSSSTGSSVPLSSLLPRPFAAINLVPPNGGVSRRGILGPAADVIQLSPSPMEGDTEVTTALTRSVVQMKTVAERLMVPSPSPPIGQEEEQENKTRAQDEKAPTPKVNEPIPKVNEPQFLVGDAFDLDPSVCGLYDRIYVGAGCEDRSIPFFASLLHPRGRLVGPFGSSMKVITKRGDGELTIEPISNVAYASIVYPEENPSAGETKEPIRFQSNVFSPPYGYSCLPPAMQSSIDALLMLQRRSGAESLFGRLPMVLLMHIMSYLPSEDYLNRRTGDVTWAVPVRANIARAREKHARASELTGDSSRAALESLLVDAVALVDHARDWLEIRLPTITDQHDSAEEDLSPGGAITVAGVETEISALTRIRDQPDTIETATFNDAINQVVQLYWTIHW